MAWVAAMQLLLLSSAAAAARASVTFVVGIDDSSSMSSPRVSLAEAATGDYDDASGGDKGAQLIAGSPIVAGAMNNRLKALTSSFARSIGKQLDYCIKDTYER